jgi:hypothetical protein
MRWFRREQNLDMFRMLPLPSANPKQLLGWKLASSSEDFRKGPRDECFRNLRRCGFAPRHILIDRACLVNVSKSAARLGAIGLRKSYGSRLVLDGVSIAINAGEVVDFLGPRRRKTTTLSLLTT